MSTFNESNVIGQLRLKDVDEKLTLGKKAPFLLSQQMERFRKRHLARCYVMVDLEYGLTTLRIKVEKV
ncbi:hypothetical protein H5410_062131 [Solanum commersonii]|uniref:Uncharacterized protein n=1 Tax=Solanum commersonii TaxID=4109 RepID=A0A9J5W9Z6_SOLCO|nr:hypothetical protein H5410_062131 [Solanum commersonii]